MNPTSMHLTDDQIDDYLIGDLAPEAEAHLDACGECMARVAEAEAPIASFRAVSMAWSERRSATLPAVAPAERAGLPKMAWGAITAALVVGMAIPAVMHRGGQPVETSQLAQANAAVPAAVTTAVAPAEAVAAAIAPKRVAVRHPVMRSEQIEQDNRMLAAIDRELDVAVATPASFGLEAGGGAHARNRIAVRD